MSPHISLFSWANFSDETRAPAGGHMALRQLRQLMNLMDLMPQFSIHWWLVGGIPTPLKNDGLRQWTGWHPIYILYILWKIKKCLKHFETTDQLYIYDQWWTLGLWDSAMAPPRGGKIRLKFVPIPGWKDLKQSNLRAWGWYPLPTWRIFLSNPKMFEYLIHRVPMVPHKNDGLSAYVPLKWLFHAETKPSPQVPFFLWSDHLGHGFHRG